MNSANRILEFLRSDGRKRRLLVIGFGIWLTSRASAAPTITQQPVSIEVNTGYAANIYVGVSSAVTSTPQYRWYRNGTLIPEATSSQLAFFGTTANEGNYYATVADSTGTVISNTVQVTLLPGILPRISEWDDAERVITSQENYGRGLEFYLLEGGALSRIDWFKDGIAIPGGPYGLWYPLYSPTPQDAGSYSLRVSNQEGSIWSSDITVSFKETASTNPWLDSIQLNSVIYFLAAAPNRIMRYDLVAQEWLPVVLLPAAKTLVGLEATPEGVFIAYADEVVRRTLDLQTEVSVASGGTPFSSLFAAGEFIFFRQTDGTHCRHRATLTAGADSDPTIAYDYPTEGIPLRPLWSSLTGRLYSTEHYLIPNDISRLAVDANGALSADGNSPYHGEFVIGSRLFLSPDGTRLFQNGGAIFDTVSLTYAGSIGRSYTDLVFSSTATPVVARGRDLVAYSGAPLVETGRQRLDVPAHRLFRHGSTIFAFAAPAADSNEPTVIKVDESAIVPAVPASPPEVRGLRFSLDDAFIDNAGVVHLVSRGEKALIRWDAGSTRDFLPAIPLRGRPVTASYAPAVNRLALLYDDLAVTNYTPGAGQPERIFVHGPNTNRATAMVALNELTYLGDNSRLILEASGEIKSLSLGFQREPVAWVSGTRRLYTKYQQRVQYYVPPLPAEVYRQTIQVDGSLPVQSDGVTHIQLPIRWNEEGAAAVSGDGTVRDADLQITATLPNSVADGAWLSQDLYTIRARPNGTTVQRWNRSNYASGGEVTVPGAPFRIFRADDNSVVVVTLHDGYVMFTVLRADLSLLTFASNEPSAPDAPRITLQPASQQPRVGTSLTLTVEVAAASVLTYQWRRNGTNLPGATGISYTISRVTAADAGRYTVAITNGFGTTVSDPAVVTPQAGTGDMNGDGIPDLVWQNAATGQRALWLMNGSDFTATSIVSLGWVAADWSMAAATDFNNDGHVDILWQNLATGQRALWLMNGGDFTATQIVSLGWVDTNWLMAGATDFNGDGHVDILWQNATTGQRALWLMNGGDFTPANVVSLGWVDTNWSMVAATDFNNDGHVDILWQNTATGQRALWLMNGGDFTPTQIVSLGWVDPNWSMAVATDFNSDGHVDILWQNLATGQRASWLMSGGDFTPTQIVDLGYVPTEWSLVR